MYVLYVLVYISGDAEGSVELNHVEAPSGHYPCSVGGN